MVSQEARVTRIMRTLGFSDDERGVYVTALRRWLLTHGDREYEIGYAPETLNNEDRALRILRWLQ